MTRRHPKEEYSRDSNEEALLAVAARLGASWWQGPPLDGWIGFRGHQIPVEIKRPQVEGWKSEYKPAQLRFFTYCRNHGLPHWVWRTEMDVMRDLGARRSA